MATFQSNIDITSGGTYGMNITNGESSAKVAADLNGKFNNIQTLLQNQLPEVWTGSSLPDSLPDGKLIYSEMFPGQASTPRYDPLYYERYNSKFTKILTSLNYQSYIPTAKSNCYLQYSTFKTNSSGQATINSSYQIRLLYISYTQTMLIQPIIINPNSSNAVFNRYDYSVQSERFIESASGNIFIYDDGARCEITAGLNNNTTYEYIILCVT